MKKLLVCSILFMTLGARAAPENLNAYMMDLVQRERSNLTNTRKKEIITAFRQCSDPEVRQIFIGDDYFEETSNKGKGVYVTQDSLKWNFRVKRCYYADIDDDGRKEIIFHEKDTSRNLQLAVVLKKNNDKWDVVFREYGVFSNLIFEGRVLKSITVVEFHQYAYPCDIFKKYTVEAAAGHTVITPDIKVHVPYMYHYPVKFERKKQPLHILADTLYFYDVSLYNRNNYPYKLEMDPLFEKKQRFNSVESAWFDLVPSVIYAAEFIEDRGNFSSVLLAFNLSYVSAFPEYLFVYLPDKQFSL